MFCPTPIDLAVLVGTLSSPPVETTLTSGSTLVRYQVTVRVDDRTESVPVSLLDPSRPLAVTEGDDVVVVGCVRRRFYRAGGRTASATEVAAERVAKATPRSLAAADRLIRAALAPTFAVE